MFVAKYVIRYYGCVHFCGIFCVPSSTGGLASAALVVCFVVLYCKK